MTTHVTLIRHGETEWNAGGRWQGNAPVPLNEKGVMQAYAAAPALKGAGITRIVSSDLSRAYRTAEIIAEALRLPLETDVRWREINVGRWQGLTTAEIRSWDAEAWKRFEQASYSERVFPEGETGAQHIARTEAAMQAIADHYPGEHVLVATHGGCIRAAIHVLKRDHAGMIGNCSLTRFSHNGSAWAVGDIAQACEMILW
jgi:broad specificity phosphatase PhoE